MNYISSPRAINLGKLRAVRVFQCLIFVHFGVYAYLDFEL